MSQSEREKKRNENFQHTLVYTKNQCRCKKNHTLKHSSPRLVHTKHQKKKKRGIEFFNFDEK